MIDIHNHILFDLDDGAEDIKTSLDYIKMAEEAGITHLVLTPHFMPGYYNNHKEKILASYQEILKFKDEYAPNINLFQSAEVYLNGETIIDDIYRENFFINNTQYVLIENNLNGFTDDLFNLLFQMNRKGLRPILAHPERYKDIRENIQIAEDFMQRDVYLQINTGSLLGAHGSQVKNVALELIDRGWAHFLGSDCHCHSGIYDYAEALELIRKEFDDQTAELLSNTFPTKMLKNESVPYFYLSRQLPPKKKSVFDKFLSFIGLSE